ncbi:MAG: tetratricopeptide repeat protein [Pseudomonadales bacterium]|nr:tetratricopeptide repeat protein [Pseudomonadales bacterium]
MAKFRTLAGSDRVRLLFIAGLALALRLLYVYLCYKQNLFPDLFLDSKFYEKTALSIHQGYGAGNHPYLLSPLYPYLFQPFIENGVFNANALRVLQAFAGSIVAALCSQCTFLLTKKTGVAWAAGIICACYGPMIHYDALILVASLQTLGITLCLWLLLSANNKSSFGLLLMAGLALGFSTALRPTGLLIALSILAGLYLFPRIRGMKKPFRQTFPLMLAFAIGVGVWIAPFTIRNINVSGEAILLSANGGMNFWIGNHAGSFGVFNLPPDYDLMHDPLGVEIARKQSGETLDYQASSNWWQQKAMADIRSNPLRWLSLIGKKLLIFAHPREIPQLGLNFQWFSDQVWVLNILPFDGRHGLILALFSPLALFLLQGWQGVYAIRWPLLILLVYWAGIALFFVTGRYRAPVMPIAIILSAITLNALPELCRMKNNGVLKAAACSFLLFISIAIAGEVFRNDTLLPPTLFSSGSEERQRGMALYDKGDFKGAEEAYRQSLAIRDNSITRGNLANSLKAQGRIDEAVMEYRKSLNINPRDAVVWYNLGNTYRDYFKQAGKAMESYRRAIEFQPLFSEAYLNLGILQANNNLPDEAINSLKHYLQLAPAQANNRPAVENMIRELEKHSMERKLMQQLRQKDAFEKLPLP